MISNNFISNKYQTKLRLIELAAQWLCRVNLR